MAATFRQPRAVDLSIRIERQVIEAPGPARHHTPQLWRGRFASGDATTSKAIGQGRLASRDPAENFVQLFYIRGSYLALELIEGMSRSQVHGEVATAVPGGAARGAFASTRLSGHLFTRWIKAKGSFAHYEPSQVGDAAQILWHGLGFGHLDPEAGLKEFDELQDAGGVNDALLDKGIIISRHSCDVAEEVICHYEPGQLRPDLRVQILSNAPGVHTLSNALILVASFRP